MKLLLNRATAFLDEKKVKHPILVKLYRGGCGHICASVGAMNVLPAEAEPDGPHTALHCITAFTHTLSDDVSQHTRAMHLQLAEWIKDFNDMLVKLLAPELDQG